MNDRLTPGQWRDLATFYRYVIGDERVSGKMMEHAGSVEGAASIEDQPAPAADDLVVALRENAKALLLDRKRFTAALVNDAADRIEAQAREIANLGMKLRLAQDAIDHNASIAKAAEARVRDLEAFKVEAKTDYADLLAYCGVETLGEIRDVFINYRAEKARADKLAAGLRFLHARIGEGANLAYVKGRIKALLDGGKTNG